MQMPAAPMLLLPLLLLSIAVSRTACSALIHVTSQPQKQQQHKLGFDLDWVRRSFAEPPGLSQCGSQGNGKGPCIALVGIQSRADFFERRELIRQTWLRYATPGIDFVFVLGLPDDKHSVNADLLRWEFETHQDIVILNTTEVDSYDSGIKSYATLKWGASLGKDRYMYIVKVDDDNIVNPLQLRLLMTSLPRERVFYGRQFEMFGKLQFSLAPRKNVGPLYFVSTDLALALGEQSYEDRMAGIRHTVLTKYPKELNVPTTSEDMAVSMMLQALVPHQEWRAARNCEVYNHHRDKFVNYRFAYNNQTVACHHVKDLSVYTEAMNALEPFMKGMQKDCKEWMAGSEGYANRTYAASPSAQCQRWLQQGPCPSAHRTLRELLRI